MVNNCDYVALGAAFALWAAKRVDLTRMFATKPDTTGQEYVGSIDQGTTRCVVRLGLGLRLGVELRLGRVMIMVRVRVEVRG